MCNTKQTWLIWRVNVAMTSLFGTRCFWCALRLRSAAQAQGISSAFISANRRRACVRPPQPGPDYVWVEGYQYPQDRTTPGTTATGRGRMPRVLVPPYYVGGRYYVGQWQGRQRSFAHDHRWDKAISGTNAAILTPTITTTTSAKRQG
jgi:hypothetical protein